MASSYEIEHRKYLCEHSEVWEIVNFFGPRKESLTGTVVAVLLPAYDGDEHRFTLEVPTKRECGVRTRGTPRAMWTGYSSLPATGASTQAG